MGSMNNASKLRFHTSGRGPDLKIFVKDVRDQYGRKRALSVRTWSTIKDVKDALQQLLHIPPSAQSLYFGPIMTSAGELPNHRTLHDAGIYRSGETLLLDIKGIGPVHGSLESSISSLRPAAPSDVCVSSSLLDLTPRSLRRSVQQARRGFALGLKPELVPDGSGGTYFLHDARKVKVAVFKPADEEPYAENNPRGYVDQELGLGFDDATGGYGGGMSLRAGINPGEACLREVAAYLLDHGGFSDVPMTTLADARHPAFNTNGPRLKLSEGIESVGSHSLTLSVSHPHVEKKVGSCQEYVSAECSMDDLSPTKLSVDEVHKIAILDIRIMNADRNSSNLLCRRRPEDNRLELVPIDHGYCLRSECDVAWFDWCWLDWPQLKQPLSKKSKDYILNLDIEADVRLLQERLNIGAEALDYFRASSKLLKAGVKAGLRLYDIAVICCRNDDAGETPSRLEVLVSMASELSTSAVENGRWYHAAASKALAEQLMSDGDDLASTSEMKSPRMLKASSSANFSFFGDEVISAERKSCPPPMIQSSASSDTNSDIGDAVNDADDCEEWAAAVIADLSMDIQASLVRRDRTLSVGSDSSSSNTNEDSSTLSSSPRGFWRIPPGSAAADSANDGVTWSPSQSPRNSMVIPLPISSFRCSTTSTLRSADDADYVFQSSAIPFEDSPFHVHNLSTLPLRDVSTHRWEAFEEATGLPQETVPSAPTNRTSGIVRSQSFSAFSFKNSLGKAEISQKNARAAKPRTAESEQFRMYFLKFLDLVFTRETAAASHQRSQPHTHADQS